METTTLTNSDLTCSRITLGTRTMGAGARDSAGWDRHNALQAILEAVENGITTIDTAPCTASENPKRWWAKRCTVAVCDSM